MKFRIRMMSGIIIMAILATMVLQPLSGNNAKAASSNVKYIKNMKVFSATDGTKEQAEEWCAAQDENKDSDENNNWHVIDGNLNDGAEGELNSAVGVFLVYQTTTDAKEAVTDLAVMNERGNYSATEYENILKEQRDAYKDIVNDMKDMLEEYRTNYKNGRQSAITVHDFLNAYIEDDSKKLLGDLLLEISDDDLVELLLQANGQVLLTIQDQLAYACDTKGNTWLDRMENIGSYESMVKSLAGTKKITKSKAKSLLDKAYNEKAKKLLLYWEDILMHYELISRYEEENAKADMTDDEWATFVSERKAAMEKNTESSNVSLAESEKDADFYKYIHELEFLNTLNNYIFDDKTLMAYFAQDYDDVKGDNIYKLYPLAAALTEGQIAALNESVSLYSLIESAVYATAYNGYDKGRAADLKKFTNDDEKKVVNDALEKSEDVIEELKESDPISVYEGVEREIYDGGVAVTSVAKSYSNGSSSNWTDSFIYSNKFSITAAGMAIGSLCFSIASISCAVSFRRILEDVADQVVIAENQFKINTSLEKAMEQTYKKLHKKTFLPDLRYKPNLRPVESLNLENCAQRYNYQEFLDLENDIEKGNFIDMAKNGEVATKEEQTKAFKSTMEELKVKAKNTIEVDAKAAGDEVFKKEMGALKTRIIRGLQIGFAVVAILLAVADITMTVYTLYNYYNRDHVDIPKFMVDISYDEDGDSSFVNYKNVLSTEGTAGDLNGGGGKQWLALYSTKDQSAGDPILAPDGDDNKFVYCTGEETSESGYSPLHMFGSLNVAQNLTYADGERGYSFNDNNKGTYLFFKRDANAYYGAAEESKKEDKSDKAAGTSISTGLAALIGGGGLLVGFLIALIIFRRPKKKEEIAA